MTYANYFATSATLACFKTSAVNHTTVKIHDNLAIAPEIQMQMFHCQYLTVMTFDTNVVGR